MTLLSYRGPFPLTHVKHLEGVSQTHKWSRADQLSWLGSFLLGERRLHD